MTDESSVAAPGARRHLAAFGLLLLATGLAVGLFAPREQDPAYHRFADTRAVLGVPNGLDVLSNAAFVLAGGAGLAVLAGRGRRAFARRTEAWPWAVLFASVALTGPGSAYYHLAPDDARLFWDRLPMAAGFAALVAILLAERVEARLGERLLLPLFVAGAASAIFWRATGDLRPYVTGQLFTVLALALALALRPRMNDAAAFGGTLALYLGAKGAELLDAAILAAAGVSGHTVKHLLAAAGVGVLAASLARREAASPPSPGAPPLRPPPAEA